MVLLIVYASIALGVSFLCSMLEASLLSMPSSHVALLVDRGSRVGRQLQTMKANVDGPLSAILTLNTVAHTVGAIGVGAQAAATFGQTAVGVASAVMTLLVLVVSEIIPKTLGAVHAKPLAGFTAVTTRMMMIMTYPIIVVLQWMSRLVASEPKAEAMSRAEITAIAKLGRQAGSLDAHESKMISNLMALDSIKVAKILTPRTVVSALDESRTVDQVMQDEPVLRHSRMPIYRDGLDHVTGYVTRFDLTEAYRGGKGGIALSAMARPIQAVPEQTTVGDALDVMLRKHEHILLVVDEYGGMEGIVTLEDAIETLLGLEIVDETDAAVDLQALARQRASQKNP